jgi:cation:H+ antiporter
MVVSISAVKMGAVDLAVGNIFGSNMFNIFIISIDDLFFTKGAILSFVEPGHLVSVFFSMLMISIIIIGLTYRAERKRLFLSWDSVGIALSYIMNLLILYMLR